MVGTIDCRSKFLPLHVTLSESEEERPILQFSQKLRLNNKIIRKISTRILSDPKNPKLYPNAYSDAVDACQEHRLPATVLKQPLGNVNSGNLKTEIYLGFGYIPTSHKYDMCFFENYILISKDYRSMMKHGGDVFFIVCALADINDATLDLRFFGMRRDLSY